MKILLGLIFIMSFSVIIGTASADSLIYSTYVGGSDMELVREVVLDSSKNVYVSGWTRSADFPATPGAYDTSHNGNDDVFVFKLSPDLSTLLAATFIGGSQIDQAFGITLDPLGNVIITGTTASANFPTTVGAYDTVLDGQNDFFIVKLSPDLGTLLASTYLGGSIDGDEEELLSTLSVDELGNIFITGTTDSTDFPTTVGAYDTSHNGIAEGPLDAFVSKLNNDLTTLLASTFIGGSSLDLAHDIVIDTDDSIYIVGRTHDGSMGYPTTPGAYDETYNGSGDIFVSKLSNDLSSLVASTFIGGSDFEIGISLVLDNSGDVLVSCICFSNDYPTTTGAFLETNPGGSASIVISKLSNDLQDLKSSTFIGGDGLDNEPRLLVDSSNNIILTGFTSSDNYPTTSGAFQDNHEGGPGADDAIISVFDNNLNTLLFSTFIGGNGGDLGFGAALDGMGGLYLVGSTTSFDFPTTAGAYNTESNSNPGCGSTQECFDAFVLLFSFDTVFDGVVGGSILPIETTSLVLTSAQSFSWMIPLILSGIGIGLFVFRKSENS